jgi:serine/threonine protein kinase
MGAMQRDDDPAHAATAMTDTAAAPLAPDPSATAATGHDAGMGVTEPVRAPSSTRYELGRVIGKGGMGEVVSAKDEQIGRRVAIKRIRAADPDPKSTARFLREAKIQGQLEHPAIVPVYELSTDPEGRPFFAMKQLAGATLADIIGMALVEDPETLAKYPRQKLLRAFTEVCLAIELAHSKKIIHRDLKPANVMLGDFGEVYVLDWGIAKVLGEHDIEDGPSGDDAHTLAGAMIGTPGYMSPEQIRGDADLDGRADVYALGCVLFEILAFDPLHPRGTKGLESAKTGIDARPSQRAPDREIPPELDAACVAACQADRAKRPLTARELGDLVQRYLDGDRDLAMRKDQAARELAAAKALLDGGLLETLSESRQRTKHRGPTRDELEPYVAALRAANRALALDPKSKEAAELVSRLMLEPPVDTPPEVEAALFENETTAIVNHARIGVWGLLGYLIFFPVIWIAGLRESWLVFGGSALTLGTMLLLHVIKSRPTALLVFVSFLAQVALVALYARGLTPLLVAPGVALLTAIMYASHVRIAPIGVLWACCASGVLIPLAIEGLGLAAATTTIEGATIRMQLAADSIDPTVALIGLGGYVAVILFIATLLVRLQAIERRTSQRRIQLQAWQLAQLMPK